MTDAIGLAIEAEIPNEDDRPYPPPAGRAPLTWPRAATNDAVSFEIAFDVEMYASHLGGTERKCPHCGPSYFRRSYNRPSGFIFYNEYWRCPRLVIPHDGDGDDNSGACLDCILDASRQLSAVEFQAAMAAQFATVCGAPSPNPQWRCNSPAGHGGIHEFTSATGDVRLSWL